MAFSSPWASNFIRLGTPHDLNLTLEPRVLKLAVGLALESAILSRADKGYEALVGLVSLIGLILLRRSIKKRVEP